MIGTGEMDVWRVRLNREIASPPTPEEAERAARFATPVLRRRYLHAHAALRAILAHYTATPLVFAVSENGKPYLASSPEIRFNLSHSRELALVAVTRDVEVGVDIEHIRPLPDFAAIVERYFAPGHPAPTSARDFFRHWTRFEAELKAHGAGLYGAGAKPAGEWSTIDLDLGKNWAGAVAVEGAPLALHFHEYNK